MCEPGVCWDPFVIQSDWGYVSMDAGDRRRRRLWVALLAYNNNNKNCYYPHLAHTTMALGRSSCLDTWFRWTLVTLSWHTNFLWRRNIYHLVGGWLCEADCVCVGGGWSPRVGIFGSDTLRRVGWVVMRFWIDMFCDCSWLPLAMIWVLWLYVWGFSGFSIPNNTIESTFCTGKPASNTG